MSYTQEIYNYNKNFQTRIVSMMLRDMSFLENFGDTLDPSYFEFTSLSILCRLTQEFFTKHGEVPNLDSIIESIKEYCVGYDVDVELRTEIEQVMDQVYGLDMTNVEATKDRVIRFGRRQSVKAANYKIASLLQKDEDFDEAETIMREALQVGQNTSDLGFHLGRDLMKLPELSQASSYAPGRKVRSLWPKFDEATNGGAARGEVWIVAAQSGAGKSTALVQLGVSGLFSGGSVIHITIGDLTAVDVGLRYASRITGCPVPDIIHNTPTFQRRAASRTGMNRDLWVKDYPSGQVTMSQIRSYIAKLRQVHDVNPCVVILDYPDECRMGNSDSLYQSMGDIYSEIQAMAREHEAVAWCASQVKVQGPGAKSLGAKGVLRMEDLDQSKLKYTKCDGFASINQTSAEREAGLCRLWVGKTRRYRSHYQINMAVDYAVSSMTEIDDSDYDDDGDATSQPQPWVRA